MLRSNDRSYQARQRQAERWAELFRSRWPGLAAKCNGRIEGAVRIYRDHGAPLNGEMPGEYIVHSESQRSHYVVDTVNHTCSCLDHAHQPDLVCKHRLVTGWTLYGDQWAAEASVEETIYLHIGTGAEVTIVDRSSRDNLVLVRAKAGYPFASCNGRKSYTWVNNWDLNEVVK